jgi:hypothetical protein
VRSYTKHMKPKPTEEYTRFEDSLRRVLQVSHSELQARIERDKQLRKGQQKQPSASGRASRAKD